MHPNVFFRAFWRNEIRPVVFVAMSFDPVFDRRFALIQAAVGKIPYRGSTLTAHRVDLSKSGDSILTEINDGISHSALVLADVSTTHHDPSDRPCRNGNVMYEVGLALACRHPSEVLLIRDDDDSLLFDLSTIPTMRLDFGDPEAATQKLADELVSRLREVKTVNDARIALAVATMTSDESRTLASFVQYGEHGSFGQERETFGNYVPILRLLDKQLIRTVGTRDGRTMYRFTPIGYAVALNLDTLMPIG